MIEEILKTVHANPKVELSQSEYNRLIKMAFSQTKDIEQRAREIYAVGHTTADELLEVAKRFREILKDKGN